MTATACSTCASLADAGMNTLHLLPVFDIATIPEVRADHEEPACDLEALTAADPGGSASQEQQACIEPIRDTDGFNWGYDPWHYTTPEGSYATDPEGPDRTREFREMVAGINAAGLRVVMDVVYNHTTAAWPGRRGRCWTGSCPVTTTGSPRQVPSRRRRAAPTRRPSTP